MFKTTGKTGYRRSGGSNTTPARVNAASMGRVSHRDFPITPAFSPDTPEQRTFDSDSPRLQGLEAGH